MFSRQHGEDNLLDWVQLVCLRDDAYDWAALRTGFGVLKDAWMRFQRKHPRAPEHVVAALRTLMSRIRPCADDATIAQQMDVCKCKKHQLRSTEMCASARNISCVAPRCVQVQETSVA